MVQNKKLALSLSGGGAKSIAYLGFIDVFREAGIEIDTVLSHSGAAWLFCYWHLQDSEQIIKQFSQIRFRHFGGIANLRYGALMSTQKMINYFSRVSRGKSIEDIKDFKVIISLSDMTDWDNPVPIFKDRGSLAKIAVISSLVPPTNDMFQDKGKYLADGAFTSLYSAGELRLRGADVVVGIYSDALKDTPLPLFARNQARFIKSMNASRDNYERQYDPVDLEIMMSPIKCGLNDFSDAARVYQDARNLAHKNLEQIKQLLS